MVVILLTCAVVLTLMCVAYIIYEYQTYRRSVQKNVSSLGTVIASNSSAALAFDSRKDANEILNALKAEDHIVKASLYDTDGNLFAKYPTSLPDSVFPEKPGATGYVFSDHALVGYEEVIQENKRLGTLYLESDLHAMYSQLNDYALIGLLFIIGSLFVAYLLSNFLQKAISDPILALEETAKVITEKNDYSVRAKKMGKDEVGALTDAFNIMLSQIEYQNSEIKAFNQNLEQKVEERTAALKEQKDFIETIVNSSVDLISVFDTETRFVTVNSKCEEVYKLKKEDLIGRKITDVFPSIVDDGSYLDLQRALSGELVHNLNFKSSLNNNTYENFLIPLKNPSGKVYSVILMAHDVTKIIEANEKLEMINAELLKSNRDLEQFAYVASHDLQEPLRKIQTFSQLLSESFNDEKKLIQYHEKISQAATRMQQLIQDVLNFSRISNTEDAFVDTPLDLIIENLKTDFELLLREKKAEIIHTPLPVIKCISLQLTQLFSNLISNSLKYTDKRPVITITSKKLTREDLKKYPKLNGAVLHVQIQFSDNGIGFDPKYNEQIFAIFQRLHNKQTFTGTGIGLALCRKIVENHGGIIFADGVPGQGATFTIILPA